MIKKLLVTLATIAIAVVASCKSPMIKNTNSEKNQIVISGKVSKATSDSFEISYGIDKAIVVDLKNWTLDDGIKSLKEGEKVTVYGYMDNNLLERKKLTTRAIYIHDRNSYYVTDTLDDNYQLNYHLFTTKVVSGAIPDETQLSIKGEIINISEEDFTLKVGLNMIVVNVGSLDYDPFNKKNPKKIKVGDRVYVSAKLDSGLFEQREINANTVLKLFRVKK